MTKTVRLSDEFHRWVKAHNEEDETMEQALRQGDADRLNRAREAFEADDS